jgi:hypothetical protein
LGRKEGRKGIPNEILYRHFIACVTAGMYKRREYVSIANPEFAPLFSAIVAS